MSTLNFNKVSEGSTLNFTKDRNIDLGSAGNIMINLNWGVPAGAGSVDLDSSLTLISSGAAAAPSTGLLGRMFGAAKAAVVGKGISAFVHCFDKSCGKGVKHHGDDRTGSWASGEFIEIDATKLESNICEIVPGILSYSGHDMSTLPFAHVRVYLGTKDRVDVPLFEADLKAVPRGTMGAVFGKLTKNEAGEWSWTTQQKLSSARSFDALKAMSATL